MGMWRGQRGRRRGVAQGRVDGAVAGRRTAHHARAAEPQAVRELAVAHPAPALWRGARDSGRRERQFGIVALLVAKLRARRSAPLRVMVGGAGSLQGSILGRLEIEAALTPPVRTLRLGQSGAAAASLPVRARRVLLLAFCFSCAAPALLHRSRRLRLGCGRAVGLLEARAAAPHGGGTPGCRHARAASELKATYVATPDRRARRRRELQVAVPAWRAEPRWCQVHAVGGGWAQRTLGASRAAVSGLAGKIGSVRSSETARKQAQEKRKRTASAGTASCQ